MAESVYFRLRVVYEKKGRLVYLSHLELARALERAVRRSGLPFGVSEGFSPHMKIAFGSALSVGVGGVAEIYDLYLTQYVNPDKALIALQSASVDDLKPKEAYYIANNEKAASVAFPISTYECELSKALDKISIPEEITILKKKGEKSYRVSDYLIDTPMLQQSKITFSLEAKKEGSMRPDVFIEEIIKSSYPSSDMKENIDILSIMRIGQR